MDTTIYWELNVQVSGGPPLSMSNVIPVEAYDYLNITIDAAADPAVGTNANVEVQPGGAGRVQLLVITADQYGGNLTYKVNGAGSAIALDKPLFLVGDGAMGLLANQPPKTLAFNNKLQSDVSVQILVGRKAVA